MTDTIVKTGQRVTKEDFQIVKDLIFQGNSFEDIHTKTGRSEMTLRRIAKCDTFESFVEFSKSENARYTESMAGRVGIKAPLVPTSIWGELRVIKDKLDGVLSDVIVEAVEAKTKEVFEENKKLKRKVQDLEKEIERLSTPNFVDTLKKKLTATNQLP